MDGSRNTVLAAICGVALVLAAAGARAQVDTTPTVGLGDATPRVHALVGLTLHPRPGVVIENATVVLRDGRVDAVGAGLAPPVDARVWQLDGKVAYAGFIDPYSELGLPADLATPPPGEPPPEPPQTATGYWNPYVRPEILAADRLELDAEALAAYRNVGFTAALAAPRRGILRGQSALISLAEPLAAGDSILEPRVAQHAAFERDTSDDLIYPTSLMGAIALLRQAFYDADWYRRAIAYQAANPASERVAANAALEALDGVVDGQPLFAATDDELDYARYLKIADEFGLSTVLVGNGYEYRERRRLAAAGVPVIVPLEFPDAPAVDTPDLAVDVSLETLEHWELAPSNAAFLADADVDFAFTADGIEDVGETFWSNLRLAIERGLEADTALAALTTRPAAMLGVADRLGTVEPGRIGDLFIADADPFTDEDAEIELVFVDGEPYELPAYRAIDPEGRWTATWPGGTAEWQIAADDDKLELTIAGEDFPGRVENDQVVLFPSAAALGGDGDQPVSLSGFVRGDAVDGIGAWPDGRTFRWQARKIGPLDTDAAADADDSAAGETAAAEVSGGSEEDGGVDEIPALTDRPFPAGAFGTNGLPPAPRSVLVRGATIWTSAAAGRLEDADLLIRDGRIAAVGRNLTPPRNAMIIDAAGKHVTAGLIDAHSHTAISRGINEMASAVTLEVRISDVLNPTDIGIYRELAGGLTVANVMHGSGDPMGGQTQTIKLRWGGDADDLVFDGALPGVKFALGENVKQSNWGDQYTTRYPQSRMGVDQIIRDTFNAARAYAAARAVRRGPPVRRNLRLDTALEILDRSRAVHVHSYRQDEILAFIRIAQEYGFDIAAFQHVLEGYKVGPEIASIGAGGSTFSDWWGYKFEVRDAIPWNGALMRAAGVVTSFNSDDDELATRLNTEAAKAIKYGGLAPEEALDFVTINPAMQLGIADRVGSLEPGKDADFVIWSGDPLSTFTRAEQTWIDGRRYFDAAEDAERRSAIEAERARLVQKVLSEQLEDSGGAATDDGEAAAGRLSGLRLRAAQSARPGERPSQPVPGRLRRSDVYSDTGHTGGDIE